MLFWVGKPTYFIYLFIFLLCIAHPICAYGDDRIICYPEADDVTGEPGDA